MVAVDIASLIAVVTPRADDDGPPTVRTLMLFSGFKVLRLDVFGL